MRLSKAVLRLLKNYEGESPAIRTNMARMFMNGRLAGTGHLVILPVDQGFEHGPGRSFFMNPEAYDPQYHYKLAVQSGVSAFAAPLGMLEAGVDTFIAQVPLILKMNSSNSLIHKDSIPDQAMTASVQDALRLGCVGVGLTMYPGSDANLSMIQEIKEVIAEARSYGLMTVIWSYPRGRGISKAGETALDVVAYGAHMAALLGAHVIKVKLPSSHIELEANQKPYQNIPKSNLKERVNHIVQSCFKGRRVVVFSGGEAKTVEEVLDESRAIYMGGGSGSIIGRNCFQRPYEEALGLLKAMQEIYLGKEGK
jgi:class I fructose-bisphosphate aldolase